MPTGDPRDVTIVDVIPDGAVRAVDNPGLAVRPMTPNELLSQAIGRGVSPDHLEKLLALCERYEANQSAKVWAERVAAFQAECPPIVKRRTGGGSRNPYKFASYEDVMDQVGSLLAKHGIVVTFSEGSFSADNTMSMTCRVRVGTHVEATTGTFPVPQLQGGANRTQEMGAAMTYAKRYLVGNALNLVFAGEDADGNAAVNRPDTLTPEEVDKVWELIHRKRIDPARVAQWRNVGRLDQIRRADLKLVVSQLESRPDPEESP